MSNILLYDYIRSTASYRVRITLKLKGIDYQSQAIDLLNGEETNDSYLQLNPQGLVPALALDTGQVLHQSLAICEYLDEKYPTPALLPIEPVARAQVRGFAQVIACDTHPPNNLRVLNYLTGTLGISEEKKLTWYQHWVAEGLQTLESILQNHPKQSFCFGETPSLADVCLVAQMFNARRFDCNTEAYPRLQAVTQHCLEMTPFQIELN